MKNLIIAIDGPSASGKGTLAKRLAKHFNLPYLNSGGLYRGLAWIIKKKNIEHNYLEYLDEIMLDLKEDMLNENYLATEEIGLMASVIAKQGKIREALFFWQKDFIKKSQEKYSGCVIDGRDITTVICPDADFKFFIKANVVTRAQRRYEQLQKDNRSIKYDDILEHLKERDYNDLNRSESPLRIAKDAIIIDNSMLNIDETVAKALDHIKQSNKIRDNLLQN